MELRQLQVFIAIAEERSFTRAATRLFLTQSAVSTSVQVLERELGVSLIDRSVQPIALTVVGRAFLDRARETVAAADSAIQTARAVLTGTVSVGFMSVPRSTSPTVARMIVGFERAQPNVRVIARHVAGSVEQAELVRNGELDLAVLSLGDTPVSGVRKRPLWSEPIGFVCRRDHPLADAESLTAAQLAGSALTELPATWCVSTTVAGWLRDRRITPRVEHVVNDVQALLDFIIDGDGAALLPTSFIPERQPLVAVPIIDRPEFVTELAIPEGRPLSPAATAFADWIQSHALAPETPAAR